MYGQLIAAQTVGAGGVSSITFSAIPATFTDLVVVYSGNGGANLIFNGVTTGNLYSRRYLQGASTSVANGNATSENSFNGIFNYYGSETYMFGSVYITNYAGATNKVVGAETFTEINGTGCLRQMFTGQWSSTSAITSVTISALGTIGQYSTAYLYGLTKGSGGATAS
jgi:hypothetical protein